ncbi:MAG: response regulator [Solirubrobacteraceae bacterium]|nr:response regulator [Patulibacter sp.]
MDPVDRLSIGLVEDSDEDYYALQRAFRDVGDVRRWSSGEAFFKAILDHPDLLTTVDLLMLDLGLSGSIDGVHVAHTVRGARGGADLPIVVLTGSAEESDIERALEAGITEYEVKPQRFTDLRILVERSTALVAGRPAA